MAAAPCWSTRDCLLLLPTAFPTAPQVNSWLNSVFGDQKVPCFEVNARTVDILYHIAESSEARCRDTTLLIEDIKQKTSEYEAEGEGKSRVHYKGLLLICLLRHLNVFTVSLQNFPFPPTAQVLISGTSCCRGLACPTQACPSQPLTTCQP